ncbi:MAG: hypothetical protein BMS9Abin20_0978 [Acidimicrobiia bacterium]|nr:MAG: hypothetical protein BMS9Abin20_0978 [Acidimicrobiia bacterium]
MQGDPEAKVAPSHSRLADPLTRCARLSPLKGGRNSCGLSPSKQRIAAKERTDLLWTLPS